MRLRNISRKMGSLVVVAAGLLAAGCGTAQAPSGAGGTGGGTGGGAGAGPAASMVACVSPALRDGTFSLSEHDNGRTYCVSVGTKFYVFLHGSLAHRWDGLRPSSADLVSLPSGMFSLPIGVTAGLFRAAHPGTVSLVSTRAGCGNAGQCAGPASFRVRLVIQA